MNELIKDNSIITEFEIKSDSLTVLKYACNMAFLGKTKAVSYKIDENKLTLYWMCDKDNSSKLPYALTTAEEAINFITGWFKTLNYNDLVEEYPGGDGSHGMGFIVKKDEMFSYKIIEIEAIKIYYSK